MKLHSLFQICILFVFVSFTSCASSQGTSGTKNKKAYALFGEALQHYDIREYDKALNSLAKAIKKDPNYIQAYDLQGKIYQETDQIDLAIQSFEKTLQIDPTYKYSLYELARMYFFKTDYDKCAQYLRGLNEVSPLDKQFYNDIQKLKQNHQFASKAIKNPVPFKPENLGPKVNSKLEDYFPGLTLDESTLFFTRRDKSLNIRLQDEDLYLAQKDSNINAWGDATSLGPPVNSTENEGAFTTTVDGKYILFTACDRRNGKGSCDIWYTTKIGEQWMRPRNMGGPINSPSWESQPSMSSDGKTLYFVSNRRGGYGGTDIWVTSLEGNRWTTPKNLGPKINTKDDEQFPFIHPDMKTLYFTSNGHPGMGQSDIYYCKIENKEWSRPYNIGYPINTPGEEWNFIVNRTGDKAFFSSDGIKDSYGGMDIYTFDLYKEARPNQVSYVKGLIIDAKSKLPLGSNIKLIDVKTNKTILETKSDKRNGYFLVTLASNSNYALHVKKEGYLFHSENFALSTSSLEKPFEIEVELQKIEVGKTVSLRNVFFETDKAVLLDESKSELNVLIAYLNENPDLRIKLQGHTDNVGDVQHNLDLSKRRAKAVYSFLIANGIDAKRLEHEGYGESQPIADNKTEEGRAKNRRTEFEIIK